MYSLRKRTNETISNEASDWESVTRCFIENRQNYQPERHTRATIAGHYKQRRSRGIEIAVLKLRLICPLSKRRIVVPARSVNCTHVQCFDLTSYLRMQMTAGHPVWTCPICRVPADTGRLRIDAYISKILASEMTQNAEEVTLLQDGTFEPVVPIRPSGVVTQEDLDDVVEENPLIEDIKPVVDRGCSARNEASRDLASYDKSECDENEPSAPAKRARLDAAVTMMEKKSAQPDGHIDPPETSQDETQALTLGSVSGQHEQVETVVEVHPPTVAKCWQWFTSKESFAEHRAKSHSAKPTPALCTQCSSRSENREIYHCEDYHDVRRFSCTECPRSFLKEEQLDRHGKDHDSANRTRCHTCGGIFRHPQALTTHRKQAHHEKIDWCFVCKDVFTEDEQEHASSDAHQETLTLKAICEKLKISCANCSKQRTGTQYLFVHGTQPDVRRVLLARNCEECRRILVKAGQPSGESTRTDLSEIRRMLAEQEAADKGLKRKQKRAAEAKKKSDQMAKASPTIISPNISGGFAAHPVQAQLAHHTQIQHGPWLHTRPTNNATEYASYQGASHPIQVRPDSAPAVVGQSLPQQGHYPPFPPLRPPPTAEKHIFDEYYRQLGIFYDQQMYRNPY